MAISFADDIRPLFRDSPDIETMKEYGLDLSSYKDVSAQAGAIYARLADGSTPCDDPWPEQQIELFKQFNAGDLRGRILRSASRTRKKYSSGPWLQQTA